MTHIMVDTETLGIRPGSTIRSIGAVVFDPKTGKLGDEFYQNICATSCKEAGLTTDPDTVKWWAGQSQAAKDALIEDQTTITAALDSFTMWWEMVDGEFIWSQGAKAPISISS